jgi:hypothetical protein
VTSGARVAGWSRYFGRRWTNTAVDRILLGLKRAGFARFARVGNLQVRRGAAGGRRSWSHCSALGATAGPAAAALGAIVARWEPLQAPLLLLLEPL